MCRCWWHSFSILWFRAQCQRLLINAHLHWSLYLRRFFFFDWEFISSFRFWNRWKHNWTKVSHFHNKFNAHWVVPKWCERAHTSTVDQKKRKVADDSSSIINIELLSTIGKWIRTLCISLWFLSSAVSSTTHSTPTATAVTTWTPYTERKQKNGWIKCRQFWLVRLGAESVSPKIKNKNKLIDCL